MASRCQVEMQLSKTDGGFFAGGDDPTAADFMMIFPLELWAKMFPESLGPKCREYVERVHERYVPRTSLQLSRSDDNTRPAYKRVRVTLCSFVRRTPPDTPFRLHPLPVYREGRKVRTPLAFFRSLGDVLYSICTIIIAMKPSYVVLCCATNLPMVQQCEDRIQDRNAGDREH